MSELPKLLRATASRARIVQIDKERLRNAADEIERLQDGAIIAHSVLGAPRDSVSDDSIREAFIAINKAIGGMDGIHEITERQTAKETQ